MKAKLYGHLYSLSHRNRDDYNKLIKTVGLDNVVPFDQILFQSCILFRKAGTCGTSESRDPVTNKWTVEPSLPTDSLYLVYFEGLMEVDTKELTDDAELLSFFQKSGEKQVRLYTKEDVDAFVESIQ